MFNQLEQAELSGKDTSKHLELVEALDVLEAAQSAYVLATFPVSRRRRKVAKRYARQQASAEAALSA